MVLFAVLGNLPILRGTNEQAPRVRFRWLDALWIQVAGTSCNIACRHCFISCGPKADQVAVMGAREVECALVDGAALGMKQVYFTGGEPLLHPHIRALAERALAFAPLTIVTNALLIDDDTAGWLAALFRRSRYSLDLRVSLDGMTAAQNDPVRGRGTFDGVVAALGRLARAGLSPVVTVVEHEQGLAGDRARAEFLAFLRELGLARPRVKFLPLLRIGREVRRSGGYDHPDILAGAPLDKDVEASLLCASGRVVTAAGTYTCPILIEDDSARLGARVADGARDIRLRWSACQTCVLDGLRCNT